MTRANRRCALVTLLVSLVAATLAPQVAVGVRGESRANGRAKEATAEAIFANCFLAGTLVDTTTRGRIPVEDVRVDDRIAPPPGHEGCQNPRCGYVVELFRNVTDQVVVLELGSRPRAREHRAQGGGGDESGGEEDGEPPPASQTIRCTPGHPFFVAGRGWVYAGDLRAGDELVARGARVFVRAIEVRAQRAETFNFEAACHHTYVVGADDDAPGVLVHNFSRYIGRGVYRTRQLRGGVSKSVLTNAGRPTGSYAHRGGFYPGTRVRIDARGNPIFRSPYEMTIGRSHLWASDATHFQMATESLRGVMYRNVGGTFVRRNTAEARSLFRQFNRSQLAEIRQGLDAPTGWTWHHHQHVGKLQLVRTADHGPVSHLGGRSIWGGGAEAR